MSWNSWQEIGHLFGTFLGIRTRFRIGRRYGYSRRNWRAKGRFWEELKRQLDEQGYSIKRGTIQDASIISSDPGHAPADKPRGDVAKTRRSRDGSRVRYGTKSQFGYKIHSIIDKEHPFIRRFDTTTASVHDSQVNLSQKGETVYRDKGYFGVSTVCLNGQNHETIRPGSSHLHKR